MINLKNFFKNKNNLLLVIAISIVVVILFLVLFIDFDKKDTNSSDYATVLENKLEDTLSSALGIGKVNVLITLSSISNQEIAYETTTTVNAGITETIKKPILVNGEPVITKKLYPEILGVLIVAEGADNYLTQYNIISVTTTLLKINADKVNVLTMK